MSHPSRRSLAASTAALLSLAACAERGAGPAAPVTADVAAEAARVAAAAHPLGGGDDDLDPLVALAADARVVLLGEASHGTEEFYRDRARITRRLVEEHGFQAVVVEADWPPAQRVNRWVRGLGDDATAEEALAGFTEFPRWMWRNTAVRDLARWMRAHNEARPAADDVGFYGMDVYGLYDAADAVVAQLRAVDAAGAGRVQELYACFAGHAPDEQRYGAAAASGRSCEAQAAEALAEVERLLPPAGADAAAAEARAATVGHARSVVNAEAYFRTMYTGGENGWNLRDRGMVQTIDAVAAHVEAVSGRPARIVVWAHNTHVGDARATAMGAGGELNVGQLMRERHGANALLVGFVTYTGTVLASPDWGAPGRVYDVRPSLAGSYGQLFHATGIPDFLLLLRDAPPDVAAVADTPRLERAIGVSYLPRSERQSHYFTARLGAQFDAVLFHDVTHAVTPLER